MNLQCFMQMIRWNVSRNEWGITGNVHQDLKSLTSNKRSTTDIPTCGDDETWFMRKFFMRGNMQTKQTANKINYSRNQSYKIIMKDSEILVRLHFTFTSFQYEKNSHNSYKVRSNRKSWLWNGERLVLHTEPLSLVWRTLWLLYVYVVKPASSLRLTCCLSSSKTW